MTEIIHRYVGKNGRAPPESSESERAKAERARWDGEWRRQRAEHEKVRREERLMKLAERCGLLIPKALVIQQLSGLFLAIRNELLGWPDTLAQRLHAAGSEHEVRETLRAAVHQLLVDLSRLPEKCTGPAPEPDARAKPKRQRRVPADAKEAAR